MGKRKFYKRKSSIFAMDAITGAQEEIKALGKKINSGKLSVSEKRNAENRIYTLMNETIPKFKSGLGGRMSL